jgi:hypothetical protein
LSLFAAFLLEMTLRTGSTLTPNTSASIAAAYSTLKALRPNSGVALVSCRA